MKIFGSFLFLSFVFFASNSFARQSDSIAVASVKKVKIGPQEMEPLVDSAVLFRQSVDAGFAKKASEALSFSKYKNLQSLYSLLAETEVYAQPNEITRKSLLDLIDVYRQEGNRKGLILLNNTLAVHSAQEGDREKSAFFFKEALHTAELLKDKPALVQISQNLSALYKLQEKYNDALTYAQLNMELNSSLLKANDVGNAYLRIASIKTLQGKFRDAEYYILKKAFPLFRRMGNKTGRMMCFQSLAEMYKTQNRLSEAKWFYVQAVIMAEKLHNSTAKINYLFNLAVIKNELGDAQQALADYRQAEELAKAEKLTVLLIDIKGNVGDIYRKAGNYFSANSAIKEYNELKASYLKGFSVKAN